MVVRVGDLIESILKQREEFLSIVNDNIDVISIGSIDLYKDLLYILDNVPSILIHGMSISNSNIYITVKELSADNLDIDISYDKERKSFSISISPEVLTENYKSVDSMDEFIALLADHEPGHTLALHPYGIVSSRNTLAQYGVFPSFLYPVAIDFGDIESQYLYLFKDKYKYIDLLGFDIGNLSMSCSKSWNVASPINRSIGRR